MTKIFNPKEWLEVPEEQPQPTSNNATINVVAVADNDIETYISAIELSGIDITGNYATWRDLGFALADEYGETGRDYFHRISKNYVGYDLKNDKYGNLLELGVIDPMKVTKSALQNAVSVAVTVTSKEHIETIYKTLTAIEQVKYVL